MKWLIVLMMCGTAMAEKKPDPAYQDGILKSYHSVSAGRHCSGGTTGNVSNDGDIQANTTTNCANTTQVNYTVVIGEQTFVLAPKVSGKKVGLAMATMGYSLFFQKSASMYGQLPGTVVHVWSEDGTFHVRAGKRESLYKLVSAE